LQSHNDFLQSFLVVCCQTIGWSLQIFYYRPVQIIGSFLKYFSSPATDDSEIFVKLIRKSLPVRRVGSAALDLCWTAAGRFDGFYEHKLQAWDSAAGYLIVQEAGGVVTDLKGDKFNPYQPGIIASNGKIHDQLLALMKGGSL
jgi:fructose-1,6-bisphosphatase/inositol monophosphatase family enzyme